MHEFPEAEVTILTLMLLVESNDKCVNQPRVQEFAPSAHFDNEVTENRVPSDAVGDFGPKGFNVLKETRADIVVLSAVSHVGAEHPATFIVFTVVASHRPWQMTRRIPTLYPRRQAFATKQCPCNRVPTR